MKLLKLLLVALFFVGILLTLMGSAGVGALAGGCVIAAAIMDHTDRVLAKKRKDSSEDNSEKA